MLDSDSDPRCSRYKISFLPLVPFQIQEIINHPMTPAVDLTSIDVVGSGSAYLHPDTAKKLMHMISKEKFESGKLGIDDGYALSESVSFVSVLVRT